MCNLHRSKSSWESKSESHITTALSIHEQDVGVKSFSKNKIIDTFETRYHEKLIQYTDRPKYFKLLKLSDYFQRPIVSFKNVFLMQTFEYIKALFFFYHLQIWNWLIFNPLINIWISLGNVILVNFEAKWPKCQFAKNFREQFLCE